jgi:mono/diheme cytochrome c family protein
MKLAAALLAFLALAAAGAGAFVWLGIYDISASDQHLRATYHAIRTMMHRSVTRRADAIEVPPLGAPAQLERGVALFRAHCVQCHGAPGLAPAPFALSMRPLATPLARSGRDQTPGYLYWAVKHGIKMTGMPAWEFRMSDADMWAVVAFVRELPRLSPTQYQALAAAEPEAFDEAPSGAPDPKRGKRALDQYACVACHEIPGMIGPEARLGPTLHGMGGRLTIGGVLPNSPANMARWIRDPKAFSPAGAMPALGVTERDARDMAAFLATLR